MNETEKITGTWYLYSVSTDPEKPVLSDPIAEIKIKSTGDGNLVTTFIRNDEKPDKVTLKRAPQHHYYLGNTNKGKYRIQVTTRYRGRPMLFGYATADPKQKAPNKDSFIGFRKKLTIEPKPKYPVSIPMHRLTFDHRYDHPHENNRHLAFCQESATLTLADGKQIHFKVESKPSPTPPGLMLTMEIEGEGPGPYKKKLWGWLLAVEDESALVFNCIFHHNLYDYDFNFYGHDSEEHEPLGSPGDPRCADGSAGGNG